MRSSMNRVSLLVLAAGFFTVACGEPDPVTPAVPTTYNFENVDYSGQQARIQMLDMLEREAKKANDGTTQVTAADLTAIFENTSGTLAGTDKNIASKTHSDALSDIYAYFGQIEQLSGNPLNVKDGYLVDANGVEPVQMIAKGLMSAHQYWQATAVYLGEAKMNVDNKEVVEGKGTAMQHHWDEAFGYFGAPKDFPVNEGKDANAAAEDRAWYWAKYANSRAAQVDIRQDIMNAFIKGRAAIGRNDMAARDEAIATIREKWELLAAANVVHYINSALTELKKEETQYAAGKYFHAWSEAKAFAGAFRYNPGRKITDAEINQLHTLLGENPGGVTVDKQQRIANLENAALLLKQVFGFSDTQIGAL